MSGWKDWAIGEVVTESEFQSFVQDQVVQVYDDATDRDNTLGANVTEGMMCYLKDVDMTQVYDGTNWVSTVGDITEVIAGDGLSGGGSSGSVTLSVDESALEITKSQVTDFEHASTHESGGSDEIEITQSQVTGLDTGTEGFTAVSNGTAGLSYQPVSHNYIINGAFDIWQRLAPGETSFSLTTNEYTADRWLSIPSAGGATVVYSKEAFTLGELPIAGYGEGESYLRISNPGGATAAGRLRQPIEQLQTLSGNDVTLSFYAKADGTKTIRSRIFQEFGSGGSTAVNFNQDVTLSTSWQRFTQTVTLPSLSGKTFGSNPYLAIEFLSEIDQAIDYDIWGVQLEAGSIATPFKRNANSIAGEEIACFRYYYRLNSVNGQRFATGFVDTSTTANFQFSVPVSMRSLPTITPSNLSDFEIRHDQFGFTTVTGINIAARFGTILSMNVSVASGLTAAEVCQLRCDNSTGFLEFGAEL